LPRTGIALDATDAVAIAIGPEVEDSSTLQSGRSHLSGSARSRIDERRVYMRFITIGYGDEDGYAATNPTLRQWAHAHDVSMAAKGAVIGVAGPAVQVRNPDGTGVEIEAGPFLRADLPLAGFALIEAANIDVAIALVAATPCAVAHGVVEVWPLTTEINPADPR
jgi:hypothetical protein